MMSHLTRILVSHGEILERVTRGKRGVSNTSCGGQTQNSWSVCAKIWYVLQRRAV